MSCKISLFLGVCTGEGRLNVCYLLPYRLKPESLRVANQPLGTKSCYTIQLLSDSGCSAHGYTLVVYEAA